MNISRYVRHLKNLSGLSDSFDTDVYSYVSVVFVDFHCHAFEWHMYVPRFHYKQKSCPVCRFTSPTGTSPSLNKHVLMF
jgi:hypothetical protein